MCQASTCGWLWARARVQVLQNSGTWKSDGSVKIYNSVSARLPLTKSKKKKYRAQQYKKCVWECTDWLSATQNGLGAAKGFSSHQELNPYCLTLCNQSYPLSHGFVSIAGTKQYICHLQQIFGVFLSSSCQRWSLHGFHNSISFATYLGCKLWLQ